jgi:hypothetical protein
MNPVLRFGLGLANVPDKDEELIDFANGSAKKI